MQCVEPRRRDWVGAIDPDAEVKPYAATGPIWGGGVGGFRGKIWSYCVSFEEVETMHGQAEDRCAGSEKLSRFIPSCLS